MAKKTAKKKTAAKAAKKPARKPNAAFMKPVTPSPALAEVIGSKPIPRTEVTKKLWAYIKKNGLQDPKNRRMIKADDALKPVFGGNYWVQLGSYVNPAVAKDGWRKFTSRTPALKPYKVTTTTATVKGTPVWRVAATGFASYGDAANMCRTVKRRGGVCLVVTAPKGLGGGGGVTARR